MAPDNLIEASIALTGDKSKASFCIQRSGNRFFLPLRRPSGLLAMRKVFGENDDEKYYSYE
jgi:hypothetical protein